MRAIEEVLSFGLLMNYNRMEQYREMLSLLNANKPPPAYDNAGKQSMEYGQLHPSSAANQQAASKIE